MHRPRQKELRNLQEVPVASGKQAEPGESGVCVAEVDKRAPVL